VPSLQQTAAETDDQVADGRCKIDAFVLEKHMSHFSGDLSLFFSMMVLCKDCDEFVW